MGSRNCPNNGRNVGNCVSPIKGLLWRGQCLKCCKISNNAFVVNVLSFFGNALHIHRQNLIHTYIHTHTHSQTHLYINIYIQMYIYIYIYIHTHTHTHSYVHTYVHTYIIHTYKHTHIYVYIYIYTHTHIHKHSMDPCVCHKASRMWNKSKIHKIYKLTMYNNMNILQELYYKLSLPIKNSSTELKDVSEGIFSRLL